MFARLLIAQFKVDKLDEAAKVFEEGVVPGAKSQKGYHRMYMLADRKTGKAISISLWDSEENATAYLQSSYYQAQVAKVKDFFLAPPVTEGYEVIAQG
jgi:heme-degrading monooxygenase HmoA